MFVVVKNVKVNDVNNNKLEEDEVDEEEEINNNNNGEDGDGDLGAFKFQEYNEDGDYDVQLDDNEIDNNRYESAATQEAKHMLSKKEQEIFELKNKREKELYAIEYIKEQEMKRMEKIRRLEMLIRHTDVMQVQFDARIMQLKNTIDELQAEMLVAESVSRARQYIPIEEGFEEGYGFSSTEADVIVSSMAERSMNSHSSFVASQTFPLSKKLNLSTFRDNSTSENNSFADDSSTPFMSTNSSYPNMIKRLVNAYAGRPNLSGRASTESHRLLREKLRKVLDWNY